MADQNSLVLAAASWLPPGEWDSAADLRKRRYLEWVGDRAAAKKREQIAKGVGADGRRLAPVKPASRPDGATGKPLDPHYAGSRSVKWLRDSEGLKAGTVTLWWSHGFGKILGYHARGEVIGTYIRDVIGFPRTYLRELQAQARHFWKTMDRVPGKPPRKPPAAATVAPIRPIRPIAPVRRPAASPHQPRA